MANNNQEALLIDRKANVFFKSYKKIRYRLAINTVEIIIAITKLLILRLKNKNKRIKKAFWGPAIIKQVFQFKKLKT